MKWWKWSSIFHFSYEAGIKGSMCHLGPGGQVSGTSPNKLFIHVGPTLSRNLVQQDLFILTECSLDRHDNMHFPLTNVIYGW